MKNLVIVWCLFLACLAQYTTVAIVGINDIHGTALPTLLQREDTMQNYTYGGLEYMASLINIIK